MTVSTPFFYSSGVYLVNGQTLNNQTQPSIAVLQNGNYVATWATDGTTADNKHEINARMFNSQGVALGAEFQVNSYTSNDQERPKVIPYGDGGFVITWDSLGQDGSGYGVYAQRYGADGAKIGAEFRVNTTTANSQAVADIYGLADGGFIVTYDSATASSPNVYGRRFDANGAAVGNDFLINTFTAGAQYDTDVIQLSGGNIVVAYTSHDPTLTNGDVHARMYDAAGNPVGVELTLNATGAGDQYLASLTPLTDGGFVATWTASEAAGGGYDIYMRRFASDGTPAGNETRVNTTTSGTQNQSKITALSDGGFVVVWQSLGSDGWYDLYAQKYDDSGNPAGYETLLLSNASNLQTVPDIWARPDGGFSLLWQSAGQDGSGLGIYGLNVGAPETLSGGVYLIDGSSAGDNLIGTTFQDLIRGYAGNDVLDGGAGADTLVGGSGDDLYVVDNIGDIATELMGEGLDTVFVGLNGYTLPDNVENLTLTGDDAINGAGNAAGNTLTGNTGANLLDGGLGNDVLQGCLGDDILTGGGGADLFVFASGDGLDTITDFNASQGDRISLEAGLAYTIRANENGDAQVIFGVSDTLTLVGVQPAAVSSTWFV